MEEKQPWWNDKDKLSGLAATIVILGLAVSVSILLISLSALVFFKVTGS